MKVIIINDFEDVTVISITKKSDNLFEYNYKGEFLVSRGEVNVSKPNDINILSKVIQTISQSR